MRELVISGNKIELIAINPSYTDLIVKWRNNKRVKDNFLWEEDLTPSIHLNWLANVVEKNKAKQFVIKEKENRGYVGTVYLKDIDWINGEAEYGIFIGEDDAIGKGYGNEAAQLIIKYAFDDMKLNRIFLRVFEDNTAAIKSYENAGFKIIPDKSNMINKNGVERKLVFMKIERQG